MKRPLKVAASSADDGSLTISSVTSTGVAVEAASIVMPDQGDHPNKLPFTGILTRVDSVSDMAPHGTGGKKIVVPADVARNAIGSLLGMGVGFTAKFDGHDVTRKIGIITDAEVRGDAVHIGGFFYAADFPAEVATLRANKDQMGFSFEASRILVRDPAENPLVFSEMVFTGAAVLLKHKAAYHSTSLAASADAAGEHSEMELKDLLAAIQGVQASVDTQIAALNTKIDGVAAAAASQGASPQVVALRKMAADLVAQGHDATAILAAADALTGKTSVAAAAQPDVAKLVADGIAAALKPVTDSVAALGTKVADVAAAATRTTATETTVAAAAVHPSRKTLDAQAMATLARTGIALPEGDGKINCAALDKALTDAQIPNQQRLALKTSLNHAGKLAR